MSRGISELSGSRGSPRFLANLMEGMKMKIRIPTGEHLTVTQSCAYDKKALKLKARKIPLFLHRIDRPSGCDIRPDPQDILGSENLR